MTLSVEDVFDGLTDEDLKNTRVNDLVPLFKNIIKFIMDEINGLGGGSKN